MTTSHKKIRWGILSTANIGMAKVTPAIQQSAHSEVVAIASRDLGKARAAADQLGIAKDHCNSILIKLARAGYADRAVPLLVDRLRHAAPNQFPTYAEAMAPVIPDEARPGFLAVLTQRLADFAQGSKRQRVEKLLARLNG